MHGMMHAYKEVLKRYQSETLIPKWKTLILTDKRNSWLGQLEYKRTNTARASTGRATTDWRCEIQLPEEHFQQLMEAWKDYWYKQLRAQVQYTDAETQALQN